MPKKNVLEDALNAELNSEFYSAYLYLSMSAWCDRHNLAGFAMWLRGQASEERQHAQKVYDFINDSDFAVRLRAIAEPTFEFKSIVDLFKQAHGHEKSVSKEINQLYELAVKEKAYSVQAMLQWFITEQVEEEKTTRGILEQLKMIEKSHAALFMLDREMAARQQ